MRDLLIIMAATNCLVDKKLGDSSLLSHKEKEQQQQQQQKPNMKSKSSKKSKGKKGKKTEKSQAKVV